MPEPDQNIKRINEKLQQLITKYLNLQKENEKLKTELKNIKLQELEKDGRLELLNLRVDVLKAAKGEMNENEKKVFEKKINQYLREIDKCIALLNE